MANCARGSLRRLTFWRQAPAVLAQLRICPRGLVVRYVKPGATFRPRRLTYADR